MWIFLGSYALPFPKIKWNLYECSISDNDVVIKFPDKIMKFSTTTQCPQGR